MKLNVGGQQTRDRFPSGWVCLDILPGADIRHDLQGDPIPLGENTVDLLYCSHVLEHIWTRNVLFVLKEMYRILVPKGLIRVVVPDMHIAWKQYWTNVKVDPKAMLELLNWSFDPTWDKDNNLCLNHVGGFDSYLLKTWLEEAGFQKVETCSFKTCPKEFVGCDNPGHQETSLYMNAMKGYSL